MKHTIQKTLAVLALIFTGSSALAAEQPNVVLMLADNVGYGDIGAFAGGEVRGIPTLRTYGPLPPVYADG